MPRVGTAHDYHALSHLHYRSGSPATIERVLTLIDPSDALSDAPAAVLVISRPTLNAWWRSMIWPGLAQLPKRDRALWLNTYVRTISRVIVHPRWRGLGAAELIVRLYLAAPLTDRTEASAAMGSLTSFFARAGMREHRGCSPQRTALAALFKHHRIDATTITTPAGRSRLARNTPLVRALRTWARATHASRRLAQLDAPALIDSIRPYLGTPIAYTHGDAFPIDHTSKETP